MSLSLLVSILLGLAAGIGIRAARRRRRPRIAEDVPAWRRAFEEENPIGPPLTREEIDAFVAWRASLALPAVELLPDPERPVAAGGTRIGGPVWLGDGEAWPVDGRGAPLEFVAQVDFADLPPLPDFPTAGVLQFFVGRDMLFGADFEDPPRGSPRVLWRPDALDGGRLHPPPEVTDRDLSPWENLAVREAGLALAGRETMRLPDGYDWRIVERLRGQHRRPGIEEINRLREDEENRPPLHHVGGHPVFTQDDFRTPGHCDDFDRTLLRLASDFNLLWGDCGEAAFLIRRRDLLDRDFSQAIFYWDCA